MASQYEVLVLVQVLLDVLAAGSEGVSAGRRQPLQLFGELFAGDGLRDVLHPVLTARLPTTVTLSWTETKTLC